MRVDCLVLYLLLNFSFTCRAQCPDQDIHLTSQQAIDSFAILYPSCTMFDGGITITSEFGAVTSLEGLEKIVECQNLIITDNPSLSTLTGLDNILKVHQNLTIERNESLTDITSINQIEEIGFFSLQLHGNTVWNNDFPNLMKAQSIKILSDIDSEVPLNSFKTISSLNTLEIAGKIKLTGFDNLSEVANLRLFTNPLYHSIFKINTDFQANFSFLEVSSIDSFNVDGIIMNDSLGFLSLKNLRHASLEHFQDFNQNIGLRLESCNSISGSLEQIQLSSLDLVSLNFLERIPPLSRTDTLTRLSIEKNPLLTDISGLNEIDAISFVLFIRNNPLLEVCSNRPICEAIKNPDLFAVINDNKDGCNAVEQIEEGCITVSSNEPIEQSTHTISAHPVPTKRGNRIHFKSPKGQKDIRGEVFDLRGAKLYEFSGNSFDSSSLPKTGVYVVKLSSQTSLQMIGTVKLFIF